MDKQEIMEEIYADFAGKLIGSKKLRWFVCSSLAEMPENVISHVTQTTWFVGSMDDAWAFTFTGNDLNDQHLVFLSDDLFAQSEEQIYYTIAHEIGHVILGHRNSTLIKQSKEEIKIQEKQAHEFAIKYFSDPKI